MADAPDQPTASPEPDLAPPVPTGFPPGVPGAHGAQQTEIRREVFWHNVVREILSALAATAMSSSGRLSADAKGAATGASPADELFDGRMAVITRLGQRIPIADVYPVFACSVPSHRGARDRMLASDVQCSIFQIRTPSGEVYTLPVHEIVSIHALSESLLRKMEQAARENAESEEPSAPFGFAAFTSLARSEQLAKDGSQAPNA
jgi:hypothetical protein